jgi:hypothetical protein
VPKSHKNLAEIITSPRWKEKFREIFFVGDVLEAGIFFRRTRDLL